MDNKNIKVIDEHNIDRVGNKLFAVDVDGSNYLVYSISRDDENDNIFVSKLIHNINNTYSMINIDDSIEKEKLTSLVKELIKYAVDLDDNKLSSSVVSLPSGNSVSVIPALIDSKEQNINVAKTYITTVKKTVSRVTCDFYDINIKSEDSIFSEEEVFPVFDTDNIQTNKMNNFNENLKEIDNNINDVKKNTTVVESVPYINLDSSMVSQNNESNSISNQQSLNMHDKSEIVVPDMNNNVVNNSTSLSISNIDASSTLTNNNDNIVNIMQNEVSTADGLNAINNNINYNSKLNDQISSEIKHDESVSNFNISSISNQSINNDLVFDASKETNLNAALDEVSSTKNLSNNDLNTVREFGSDNISTNIDKNVSISSNPQTKGFASSKLLAIVSILIFLGVCCFLAYEIFNYMQVVK